MIEVRIDAPALARASGQARAGLPADLAFCHPAIRGVVAVDGDSITLRVTDDSDELRSLVSRVIDLSIQSYRFVPAQEPLWSHGSPGRYLGGPEALARFIAHHTIELGSGQYVLVGPAAELRARLDARVARLAVGLGAEPWHLPSIEQTSDLIAATGYLASGAQYVTFGYRLPTHFETLRKFTEDVRHARTTTPAAADLEPTGFILEPFVCHNVYRALRGRRLDRGHTITALGTCYRHEGFRFQPLLRQWEFSMREVVLVGSADHVSAQRTRAIEATQHLVRELDLEAQLEIATDPFFVSEAASTRAFQALRSTKLELSLSLGDSSRTAASSFNLHGTHFTRPMEITDSAGALLETACVGWGIERWMAAFIARWGAEPGGWPPI